MLRSMSREKCARVPRLVRTARPAELFSPGTVDMKRRAASVHMFSRYCRPHRYRNISPALRTLRVLHLNGVRGGPAYAPRRVVPRTRTYSRRAGERLGDRTRFAPRIYVFSRCLGIIMRAGLRDSCTITGINPTAVGARVGPPTKLSERRFGSQTLKIDPRVMP